ncbi:MAG TPA: thioredoxin domain-containing protein [Bacteroidia bacterium]
MKKASLFLVLAATLACNQVTQTSLPANEFKSDIEKGGVQVVDLRSESLYKNIHIPGALHVSGNTAEIIAKETYADMPLYLYNENGEGIDELVSALRKGGFKHVYGLKEGFSAWKKQGFNVEELKVFENDTIPFEKAILGNKLVMVDFNAVWCRPCKMLDPIVKKLRETRAKDAIVYSIDTDKNPDLAVQYKAESIPLLVFLKNGKEVGRSVGLISESKLNDLIDQYK